MPRSLLARIAAPLCRPSPEECAEDYAWFRERLASPSLLNCAVGVKVGSTVLLAVPVGRGRSGGYLSVGTAAHAIRIWAALRGRPGFPRARLGLSVHRNTCHTVNWGPPPPWDDADRGRYFGYAPSAIDAFLGDLSIPHQLAGPAKDGLDPVGRRAWEQDPLMSTLRDVGGCLAVILMGVLVTVLVSAAREAWPQIGAVVDHAEVTGAPADAPSTGWKRGDSCREPLREPQAPSRALPATGDTRWDVDPSAAHTRATAGSCTK